MCHFTSYAEVNAAKPSGESFDIDMTQLMLWYQVNTKEELCVSELGEKGERRGEEVMDDPLLRGKQIVEKKPSFPGRRRLFKERVSG